MGPSFDKCFLTYRVTKVENEVKVFKYLNYPPSRNAHVKTFKFVRRSQVLETVRLNASLFSFKSTGVLLRTLT